ncbi:MAG: ABC transporter permease [Desulfopila sp.]|jgi:ABC-type multidrug transport system permease subunit|nr:ABC transporter permease [Desulfopila sp.]
MNYKHVWAIFMARNLEFFRDKAAFGWNFAFPFLIIIGFSFIFEGQSHQNFKVGIFPVAEQDGLFKQTTVPAAFQNEKRVTFLAMPDREVGEKLLRHHKIDLLLDGTSTTHAYYVNNSSPNGYIAEKLFLSSFIDDESQPAVKGAIQGQEIRYIDWFFPGLLGMNMMFSALWGVGYIVVRYRKNGALKRLKATPLTALEFLSALTLSRIFLIMFTLAVVWYGSDLIFDFYVQGSLFLIFFFFFLGGLSLCALGLILAARGTSEEFSSGVLNFITWPMMFLSEVWFSLEGSPEWLRKTAEIFPLTQMLQAVRKIMSEGATFADVQGECVFLLIFTALALLLGSILFSWND